MPLTPDILIGRRDWDVVAFTDYEKDTAEIAEQAAHVIGVVQKRLERTERALAEAVVAAGGKIKISEYDLHDPTRKIVVEHCRNTADLTIEFRAEVVRG